MATPFSFLARPTTSSTVSRAVSSIIAFADYVVVFVHNKLPAEYVRPVFQPGHRLPDRIMETGHAFQVRHEAYYMDLFRGFQFHAGDEYDPFCAQALSPVGSRQNCGLLQLGVKTLRIAILTMLFGVMSLSAHGESAEWICRSTAYFICLLPADV